MKKNKVEFINEIDQIFFPFSSPSQGFGIFNMFRMVNFVMAMILDLKLAKIVLIFFAFYWIFFFSDCSIFIFYFYISECRFIQFILKKL